MSATPIAPGAYRVNVGGVAVYLIDASDGVTIVDAGQPGKVDKIMSGIRSIGKTPPDVNNVVITHYHNDHVGSLSELAESVRAKVWIPKGDATIIKEGGKPPPLDNRGMLGSLLSRVIKMTEQDAHPVDHEVEDGDEIDVAGGIRVLASPGHTGGHVSYLWPHDGGVLFAGDAAANIMGRLDIMPLCEDFTTAERSFVSLANEDFNAAGFGHGKPILSRADDAFGRVATRYTAEASPGGRI
jgi:glyoxylase-like metal-dependent hydrolase (beta-lactamase superfamily II)